jgi:hypothetical protein
MQTETKEAADTAPHFSKRNLIFFVAIIALIIAAIIRSSITTSLDSFTFDEAYHIGAGATYVQTRDFRLNPEQPPLIKLWVGTYVTALGYQVSPFRSYADKSDEREFVEEDAYFNNDPFVLQNRSRVAMLALNGFLMLLFAVAAWRVFGPVVSLAATAFLAIDPTVAAHMPVVMTDLPIALTSGAAILFAAAAFQTWRPLDLIFATLSLGLALGAKQSAVITFVAIGIAGVAMALVFARGFGITARIRRLGAVASLMAGSVLILWGLYFFQFHETPGTNEETFNRPLAEKITDVRSPVYRTALNTVTTIRLFPRAYIWGMADTIRAGVEGRAIPILAFGEMYYSRAPFYYFPGAIAAKLPIGLLLLTLVGALVFAFRRAPSDFYVPIAFFALFAAILLFFLARGSTYAGVRHALALFPLCALFAAFAIRYFLTLRSHALLGGAALLVIAAIVSSVPVMRPWEYFNEFAGGPSGAYKYFSDEGTDLGLRLKEVSDYYEQNLKPTGEIPYMSYFSSHVERRRRGLDWVGKDMDRDAARMTSDVVEGIVIVGAEDLAPKIWWDAARPLRDVEPVARLGNVFVFRGTFPRLSSAFARSFWFRAMYTKLYVPEPGVNAGIELLARSAKLDPTAFFVSLELANQYLKLGRHDEALLAYEKALEYAPRSDSIHELLAGQVAQLRAGAAEIQPIRNPGVE